MMKKCERIARKWAMVELGGFAANASYLDVALEAMRRSGELVGTKVQWEAGGYDPGAVLAGLHELKMFPNRRKGPVFDPGT